MKETKLHSLLRRLSHGSQHAVQNGSGLNELDSYLHVERPVEKNIKEKMRRIQQNGGGLLLLVGSAGDGKSHLISTLKATGEFNDFEFRNDATEGCSPRMTAVETLRFTLDEFTDEKIVNTHHKLLVAINLGKLLDFIEDDIVREKFKTLVEIGNSINDESNNAAIIERPMIAVVSLVHQQAFELNVDSNSTYPFKSHFMSSILDKITSPTINNPFYNAYLEDIGRLQEANPLFINYTLLQDKRVKESIINLIIEAIIRFNLIVTPREFLSFIYSILVYPKLDEYKERTDFFSASLPTMLFNGSENKIQKAISKLDPLKASNLCHDKQLSELYSNFKYNKKFLPEISIDLSTILEIKLNQFYNNHGDAKAIISSYIFRINHLLSYHSESKSYINFITDLKGYFNKNEDIYVRLADLIVSSIPRHYGSYFSESSFIPLNIQGSEYKLFAILELPEPEFNPTFDKSIPYVFETSMLLTWNINQDKIILKVDFDLYEHLYELNTGKLATAYEGERNLSFSNFVRNISHHTSAQKEVKIVSHTHKVNTLVKRYTNLQIQQG